MALLAASPAIAAGPASGPAAALPDTGLFAPVAEQLRARLARLGALADRGVTAERLTLLLDTGRMD